MIVGLTGKNGAGKGEVAKLLVESGFAFYSLSDVIRETVKKRGRAITRDRLIRTGTELREKHGNGVLAERILARLRLDRHYVIDSFRNPEEVKVFRKTGRFFLLRVAAPRRPRFERILLRRREKDPLTYRDFVETEEKELSPKNPAAQQLLATERMADGTIQNDASLAQLQDKTRKLLLRLARARKRPSWDDYFVGIARMVALRSNCVKRHVAAVIVKDRRIISTGYNGTPRGVRNCNEGGCPRCNRFGPTGKGLDECLCSHAEENSITQASYHGVNIKGSTLYTTFSPCLTCTKMIVNSGVAEVVYDAHYPLVKTATALLKEAGVKIRRL